MVSFSGHVDQLTYITTLQNRIALNEDLHAYQELYRISFNGLYRFSLSIVHTSQAAEEIVSDIFLKVWQIRRKLDEISQLKVYLFKLAKDFSLNYLHINSQEIVQSLDEVSIEPQVEIGDREELCVSSVTIEKIRMAIRQLSPRCRMVFQLIKEENFRYHEAAMILGVSPYIARNELSHAVRRIAEILPSYRQTAIPNIKSFSAS